MRLQLSTGMFFLFAWILTFFCRVITPFVVSAEPLSDIGHRSVPHKLSSADS